MKNYFQSIGYILFLIVTFIGLTKAFLSYENPFDIYENPLVWIALICLVLVVVLKELLNLISLQQAQKLKLEEEGIDLSTIDNYAWFKKLIKLFTKSKSLEQENEIILDHNYDGIKELDNSLPPWWVYMFYATILFAFVYLIRFHVLGADTQAIEYENEVAAAKLELENYKKSTPNVFDIDNVALLTDVTALKRGKAVFNLNCASCHAQDGGGGIGPNLTDKNWILGGGFKNIFNTVYNGGRSGKGMIAWKATLKPEDIQKVSSYVLTLQGTFPEKPKQAEGDVWEEE